MKLKHFAYSVLAALVVMQAAPVLADDGKLIIAHRGASGYLPEHTLESKALAIAMGVPYVEQDLAMTKDDHLVVVHDHYLDRVTDVADKFPGRARKDGRYYVIDFTLDEIKSLKFSDGFAVENGKRVALYADRFPIFKSDFRIHTLEEEIEFVQGLNKSWNKNIGLYVETKAPWFHKQEGKDISLATLKVLKKYGYDSKDDLVYFQSFDYPDLVRVKTELMPKLKMDIKTVALIGKNDWLETYELKDGKWQPYDFNYLLDGKNYGDIAKIADGLGPDYSQVIDVANSKPGDIKTNDLVKNAHEHGMQVHPYTIRKDKLPAYAKDVNDLYEAVLYSAGADGVFTDFPDLGLQFVKDHEQKQK